MKKVIFIIMLVITAAFLFLWTSVKGTPWEKKEFIQGVTAYLEQKYGINMHFVSSAHYSFKLGTYSISVRPEGMEYITFAAYQSARNKEEFGDRFSLELWTYEANKELEEVINEANFDVTVTGKFTMIGGEYQSRLYEGDMPKPYKEVKMHLGKGTSVQLRIDKLLDFNEIDELFHLVSLIQQKKFQFGRLSLTFIDNRSFYIDYDEFYALTSIEELVSYLRNN